MRKIFSLLAAVLFAGSMMAETYTKTDFANLNNGATVIITMQKGTDVFAASNDNGTGAAPMAVAVSVANDAITTDATNILWTVVKDGANITFAATDTTALYCTNTNNGVRVGKNANNVFSIDATSGYLFNNATSRYVGVYNSQDFRCYSSVNTNISGQTLAFYAKGDVAPSSVATPVISGEAEFTDSVIVTMTCSTQDADIYYTTDGTTDPKCDCAAAPEYKKPIVIKETTTIMAAAYTGNDWSAVATKTFTKKEPLVAISCAEVYGKAKGDELALNNVVVTYANAKYVYVKDETGSMLLYLTDNTTWKAGDVLAGVEGTLDIYNGLYEVKLTNVQATAVQATAGEAPAAIELTAAPKATDMNKYIVLKGVTMDTTAFVNKNINATIGEETFVIRNQFGADMVFDTTAVYDITGVVALYNTTVQVYLTSAVLVSNPEIDAMVFNWSTLNGAQIGTINYGAGTEASKVKILKNYLEVDAIKFGSSYVYTEGKYITIKPKEGSFKAGDELTVQVLISNTDTITKYAMVDVYAADGTTRLFRSDSVKTVNGRMSSAEPIDQTFTLAADQDSLLLGRYGNTAMYVSFLRVIRNNEVSPVLFEGEHAVTWDTPLNLEAAKFAQAKAGQKIVVTYKDATDNIEFKVLDVWCHIAGSREAASLDQAEGSHTYEQFLTANAVDSIKAHGLQIIGNHFTITKVELLDGKELKDGATIWTGFFWADDWKTLEICHESFNYVDFSQYDALRIYSEANRSDFVINIKENWEEGGQIASQTDMVAGEGYMELPLTDALRTRLANAHHLMFQFNKEAGAAFNVTDIVLVNYPAAPTQYEVAEAIAAGLKDDDEILVRGIITKMEFKGKNFAKYGSINIYVADATGAQGEFEFYNCYSLEADTFRTSTPAYDPESTAWAQFSEVVDGNGVAIHVGDTVIARGLYKLYNETHELNTGCYLTDIKHAPVPVSDTITLAFDSTNTTYAFVDNEYYIDYGTTDLILSDININTTTNQFEGDGKYLVLDFYPENPNDITGTYTATDESLDLEYTYMLEINGTDTAEVEFVSGEVEIAVGRVNKDYNIAEITVAGLLISTEGDVYAIKAEVVAYYDFLPEEGVENVVVDPKAIKRIECGQIVIEKNGVKYNAAGALIR